jgi:hypothetical protein
MNLSDTQKSTVTAWIQDGKTLAEVQRMLREEFSLSMTYMDVRFLIDDLEITFAEPEAEETAQDADVEAIEPEVMDAPGEVSVEVDAIVRPGALVSGTVKFTDGVSLGWQLASSGQLGLIPGDDPNYRPDPEDIQVFQTKLEDVLREKGL